MINCTSVVFYGYRAFQRLLDRKSTDLDKTLWHLGNQEFKCPSDAEKSMQPLLKSLLVLKIGFNDFICAFYIYAL